MDDKNFEVDWYRPIGEKLGEENWYLRIRKYNNGFSELTWKGKEEIFSSSRRQREIEFPIINPDQLGEVFTLIGFEHYAHQEKKRSSWEYKSWKFDLDQYSGMPAYLEVEGLNDAHIVEAIGLLNLMNNERCFDGERVLIMKKYGLDWLDMRF